ncbi:MAG: pilus assembly protein TadG-related protein [Sporichthyaceae bacterium]|nr:pilus assembly protein TadG-related protein [Sporichthyaceae bacterium]
MFRPGHALGSVAGRRPGDDRGAYAVLYAMLVVVFIGLVSLVLDLGLLRMDRRTNRAAADAAAVAGSAALGQGGNSPVKACQDAMRYAEISLSSSVGADNCESVFGGAITCTDATVAATATEVVDGRTISITWPVLDNSPLLTDPDREHSIGTTLTQPNSSQDGDPCQRIAVQITQQRQLAFAAIWSWSEVTTSSHSVGLADEGGRGGAISPLVTLDPTICRALQVNDASLTVQASADGELQPGEVSVDSDGTGSGCTTSRAVTVPNGGSIDVQGSASGAPGHIYTLEDNPTYPGCTPLCPTPEHRPDPVTDAPWRDRYNCDDAAPEGCANKGANNANLPSPHDYVDQFVSYDPARPPFAIPLANCLIDTDEVFLSRQAVCPGTDPLEIEAGSELEIIGSLEVIGELNVSGWLEVSGDLYVDPSDHIEVTGGTIVVGGTLTIRDLPGGFDLEVSGNGRVSVFEGMFIDDDIRVSSGCVIVSKRLSDCVGWTAAATPLGATDTDGVKLGGDLSVFGSGQVVFDQTFLYVDDDIEVTTSTGQVVFVAPYRQQHTSECIPSNTGGLPTSGCFEDLAVWAAGISDPLPAFDHVLTGNSNTYIDGTIYDPNRRITLFGDFPVLTAQLVADQVWLEPGSELTLIGDGDRSTLVPRSGGSLIR